MLCGDKDGLKLHSCEEGGRAALIILLLYPSNIKTRLYVTMYRSSMSPLNLMSDLKGDLGQGCQALKHQHIVYILPTVQTPCGYPQNLGCQADLRPEPGLGWG